MPHERLTDRGFQPTGEDMIAYIGLPLADSWTELRRFLVETFEIVPILQFAGKRFGWNIQHRKGGRPLCEIYPECGSFVAMVVLGRKEWEQAMEQIDSFGPNVRQRLLDTPLNRDGVWLYTRISDPLTCQQDVQDIEQLVLLKKIPKVKD